MAKNDEKKDTKKDSGGVEEQRRRLRDGEQLQGGWCFDPARDPDIFQCGDVEESVARGDVSVSYDGAFTTDLKTGEVARGDVIQRKKVASFANVGAGVPATAADSVTTDNAPPGTGGGATGGRTTA